jgi:hypothetical protein
VSIVTGHGLDDRPVIPGRGRFLSFHDVLAFHEARLYNIVLMFQEASGELSWDEGDVAASYTWSFNEFLNQFSELYSWLNSIQEAVYGKEDNVTDRSLRVVSVT